MYYIVIDQYGLKTTYQESFNSIPTQDELKICLAELWYYGKLHAYKELLKILHVCGIPSVGETLHAKSLGIISLKETDEIPEK